MTSQTAAPESLFLDNIYICSTCSSHLSALQYQLSDKLQGKFGIGYLMDFLTNINQRQPKDIFSLSGKQTMCEVECKGCGSYVGWKYLSTEGEGNKEKVNKFVLEKKKMAVLEYCKQD